VVLRSSHQIWVFNRESCVPVTRVFAFIVKRFRVFRAPLHRQMFEGICIVVVPNADSHFLFGFALSFHGLSYCNKY
ncbi:hypothetical protein ACT7C1_10515, partial [Bacillus paranthracis]